MIMARNEDGTYSQVGFVKDNNGVDTEYIYDKDGDKVFEKGFTRETSGTVPLTINGIEKDLKDWSITGNTVQNGTPTPENPVEVVGVGDRTANLFDYSTITTGYRIVWTTGDLYKDDTGIMSDFIEVTEGQKYRISDSTKSLTAYIIGYNQNKEYLGVYDSFNGFIKSATKRYSVLKIQKESGCQYIKLMTFISYPINATSMFIEGEAVPNEFIPYGYKIPVVTKSDGAEPITTPIYLPTPLYSGEAMRSDGTIARSDGTTETFTAPQIPTLNGTTVIDVDTAVKPTEMYIKYKSSK